MRAGIYLVHKEEGPTSFSVVKEFMGASDAQAEMRGPGRRGLRICHGGTLDPFASGLLLILVEPATKLFEYLHEVPKVYEATVRWGMETDNGDPGGKVTFEGDSSGIREEQLEEMLRTFVGWQEQVPHATSAKRIGGERAYVKAHRGETVVMPASRVYLHEAKWLGHDLPGQSRLRMTTRGGYYVRALARDLGRKVGCGAHLMTLRRTAIGPWEDPGAEKSVALHGRDVLPWVRRRVLSDFEVGELRRGREIPLGEALPADWELPAGFPESSGVVRGFHLEKFIFLLGAGAEGKWKGVVGLKGGV